MKEDELDNNDYFNDNFQQELKNSQVFKTEYDNEEKAPDYNEINDDIFQYSLNKSQSSQKDYLNNQNKTPINYLNKECNSNINDFNLNSINFDNNNKNSFSNSPQRQIIDNNNEDISGISLLKELEEQWNNIEKQKMNYYNRNKGDESTISDTKNYMTNEKFKYIKDMVECKKSKFLSLRQKAKNIRNNDHDIEQFFLNKFKEMEKYKITDKNLKEKIEIRQKEKLKEEQMNQKNFDYNNNENINDENYFDEQNQNNNENYINEDNFYEENQNIDNNQQEINQDNNNIIFNKQPYYQNDEDEINYNQINDYENNQSPELDDLIYETPARTNNFGNEILEKIRDNNYNEVIQNELKNDRENNNIPENKSVSGKLMKKMKNLYDEINGQNYQPKKYELKENNNNNKKFESLETGVLGINNINIINNNFTDNNYLMNIKNVNRSNTNKINDANKSINLNFNYNNNYDNTIVNNNKYTNNQNYSFSFNNIQNYQIYEPNQNKSFVQNELLLNKDINRFPKNENNNGLISLEQNFDNIMKQIKSNKANKTPIRLNLFENDNINSTKEENGKSSEFDKYFEELTKEAKLNIKKGKTNENMIRINNNEENKIKKKIEENSEILNKFVNDLNINKNKFKQRMLEINNNLNNIKIKDEINNSFNRKDKCGIINTNNNHKKF